MLSKVSQIKNYYAVLFVKLKKSKSKWKSNRNLGFLFHTTLLIIKRTHINMPPSPFIFSTEWSQSFFKMAFQFISTLYSKTISKKLQNYCKCKVGTLGK